MGYLIAVTVGFLAGMGFGALAGDESGYERGCQETHDYYRAKGARR